MRVVTSTMHLPSLGGFPAFQARLAALAFCWREGVRRHLLDGAVLIGALLAVAAFLTGVALQDGRLLGEPFFLAALFLVVALCVALAGRAGLRLSAYALEDHQAHLQDRHRGTLDTLFGQILSFTEDQTGFALLLRMRATVDGVVTMDVVADTSVPSPSLSSSTRGHGTDPGGVMIALGELARDVVGHVVAHRAVVPPPPFPATDTGARLFTKGPPLPGSAHARLRLLADLRAALPAQAQGAFDRYLHLLSPPSSHM